MIIDVDLTSRGTGTNLIAADDFGAFHVRAWTVGGAPDWDALEAALGETGRVGDESAFITVDGLTALAGERASSSDWRRRLAGMISYAESHGWSDGDGAIAAHVEWQSEVPIEAGEFRRVLGHLPTGVAVITAQDADGPVGMSCNSLTSVSLDPPLIAVFHSRESQTWPRIRQCARFVVNVTSSGHRDLVRQFAERGVDRFAGVGWHGRATGPALDDALAWIECATTAEYPAGDHTICLARVLALEVRGDVNPLIFFRGSYGTFAER